MNAFPADAHGTPGTRCSSCDRTLAAGARFCPGCGTAVEAADRTTDPTGLTTGPAATSEPEVTAGSVCRVCGGRNDPDRSLCGRCGVDLATGDPELTVAPAPSPTAVPTPSEDEDRPGMRGWMAAVVVVAAIAVVIGGVIATLVVLRLGPFATTEDVPEVAFDAARYSSEPEPLLLTDVATLTVRPPAEDRSFTADHLVDGNTSSSWQGDTDELPVDTLEKVDLFLEAPAWVAAVVVGNGDHRDSESYATAARVQRAQLIFDGDVRVPVTLLDQGRSPQIVELEEPVLSTAVRMEIIDVVRGTDGDDVAITRMELLGHPATGEDVELAEQREAALPAAGAVTLGGQGS